MKIDQLPPQVLSVRRMLRATVFTCASMVALAALALTLPPPGVLLEVTSGLSILADGYSFRIYGTSLDQLGQPRPAWLASMTIFAYVSGPALMVLGTWLLFR